MGYLSLQSRTEAGRKSKRKQSLSFIYCHPQQLKPPLVTNSQLELDSSDLSLVYDPK